MIDDLPTLLRDLAGTRLYPGLGAWARFSCRHQHLLRRVRFVDATLVFVGAGAKIVSSPLARVRCEAGSVLAVPAGTLVDVENVRGRSSYDALIVTFDDSLLDAWSRDLDRPYAVLGSPRAVPIDPVMLGTLRHVADVPAGQSLPEPVARHRLRELLLVMAEAGVHFGAGPGECLSRRVEMAVRADPAGPWPTARICNLVGLSEATLRRRLRQEGTSLSFIISEVRLSHALVLVQVSTTPIGSIALASGFESLSSFTRAFRPKFGVAPSSVRGPPEAVPARLAG